MKTTLFLIRHGITKWNEQGRYCGHKNVGLSDLGRRQAVRLRNSLQGVSFDGIYCSDRKRALETKTILFENGRNLAKAAPVVMQALREINFGVFEGLRHNEIIRKYPEAYKKWLADPYRGRIPGAEPMRVFKKRVCMAMKKIMHSRRRGKAIAVVCHGGVIAIFVSSILRRSRDFWNYVPLPASITRVEYENNKFKLVPGAKTKSKSGKEGR